MKKKDPTSHRIIEKRRRDRMNNCLADLSKLIPSQYMRKGRGRVEKTEIIEMAIRLLKDLRESPAGLLQRSRQESAGEPCQEDLSCGQRKEATGAIELSIDGGHTINRQPMASSELTLDCTSQGAQRLASISGNDNYMTDSNGIPHAAPLYNHSLGHPNSVAMAPTSASLSMKAFQHQQYHNNERQINNRANEQNSKYRNECCTCRGRATARSNESAGSASSSNKNNISNSNNKNNSSSSDQSDTGSIDYPSSSSGSNNTETINKSTSVSSSGEGSPTSSSSSSSSSSSGWYKKAWLIRSFSRSVSKN